MKRKKKPGSDKSARSSPEPEASQFQFAKNWSGRHVVLVISLLGCMAYANSLGGDFVFDDIPAVVSKPDLRSGENLGRAFTTDVWAFRERAGMAHAPPPLPYYRPVITGLMTIEYQLFGTERTQAW